jgi:hypothetical protein
VTTIHQEDCIRVRSLYYAKEIEMAEMKHLHLFPTELPKDEALVIINGIRGIDDGRSNRDRVEAAWWIAGYALSMIPDTHPPMGASQLSDEDVAAHLETAVNAGPGMQAIPWSLILPLLLKLIERWMS